MAWIRSQAQELLYAVGGPKKQTKQNKTKTHKKKMKKKSSHRGAVEMNPTGIHEDAGLIPGLAQWVRNPALL